MAYRGRLIQKFQCLLRRVDASAIETADDFDDDFRVVKSGGRVEMDADIIPCQLDRHNWGKDVKTVSGHEIIADIVLVLHWPDLERLGLIDAEGQVMIAQGDRLESIQDRMGGLAYGFDNPPGMLVVHKDYAGYGLFMSGTPKPNLLILYCAYASESVKRTI